MQITLDLSMEDVMLNSGDIIYDIALDEFYKVIEVEPSIFTLLDLKTSKCVNKVFNHEDLMFRDIVQFIGYGSWQYLHEQMYEIKISIDPCFRLGD